MREELFEECNIVVEEARELVAREYVYERKGRTVHLDSHLFEILRHSGELRNNEPQKHTEQRFMELEKIKRLPHLSDATLCYLEYLGFERPAVLE